MAWNPGFTMKFDVAKEVSKTGVWVEVGCSNAACEF